MRTWFVVLPLFPLLVLGLVLPLLLLLSFGLALPPDRAPLRAACILKQDSQSVALGDFASRPHLQELRQFGEIPIVALKTSVTLE